MMFDHLVEVNDLQEEFEKYDLTDEDTTFIKEQIKGPRKDELSSQIATVCVDALVDCTVKEMKHLRHYGVIS